MKSRWSDTDAKGFVKRYAGQGINEDLALRTYTTRLLGGDPKLVLHGGGNTSVKTIAKDQLGDDVDVICVKGSGWDMGNIEPAGLPAVRLAPLRRLRALDKLADADMVNFQRINLLDSGAPNPSVETLLHAFLPHKFIDHTHSTAVLALTDQPDGEAIVRDLYGARVAYVPYTIPGFALAKSVADIFDKHPDVEGLVLLRHGIFTFADDAKTAYERMIEFVTMAEQRLQQNRKPLKQAALPANLATAAEIAPILRGAVALSRNELAGTVKRQVLDFRDHPAILNYVSGAELSRYSQVGVVTPDHTIRTKNWPLLVPAPEAGRLEDWKTAVHAAVEKFVADYHAYFARNNAKSADKKVELDPLPRVVLVPGVGLFGLGASAKDAAIAADIAENTVDVITDAEAIGRYECISEFDMFEVEYWSLEQA
ncbi:MAG: bifunctional aldolase/short-chain dehydrogenase, partial [Alphaproteobacteria bacterium]|nr:bifunctional aldolase/short-chain dehydrogenase [Alphaproteobacteria bacterium]